MKTTLVHNKCVALGLTPDIPAVFERTWRTGCEFYVNYRVGEYVTNDRKHALEVRLDYRAYVPA